MSPVLTRLEELEGLLAELDAVRDKIAHEVDVLAEAERRAAQRRRADRLRVVR